MVRAKTGTTQEEGRYLNTARSLSFFSSKTLFLPTARRTNSCCLIAKSTNFREDVRFGYLDDIESLIQKFKLTYPSKPLSRFSCALADAIQHRHIDILEHLLIAGVPVTSSAVRAAANKRCRQSLSLLLHFGWDINRPLSGDEPPILWYLPFST